ncbi:zinc-dependent alcohol dehydrogenase family protein [Pseudomaricurvus sp.]|uniref:zinc-dependent alcohol dehydrogenase family protein n=1 Tax=Pseudomaricurvus sp. TaxID=2004510 RepID=UPI003F6C1B0A
MKAALATAEKGIESIHVIQAEIPQPGSGEALVRLSKATLNYRDLLVLRGLVPNAKTPAYVPLSDAVGEVVAVAEDVTRVSVGDRVSPLFAQGWLSGSRPTLEMLGGPVDGVAREYAVFHAESLCHIPDELSDLQAAALPCAGLTAWNALFGTKPVEEGDWVLLQGTGGVSIAALLFAKAVGAKVIITSSSDVKLQQAQSLGADVVINYRKNVNWETLALQASGGHGVDLLVDVVGESQLKQSAKAVKPNGVIAAVGRLQGEASWGMDVGKKLVPIVVGNREQHEAMLTFCAKYSINLVIDSVYPLEELSSALQKMESGNFFGKIALDLR